MAKGWVTSVLSPETTCARNGVPSDPAFIEAYSASAAICLSVTPSRSAAAAAFMPATTAREA